ncbi:MAG: AMP-binding protein [Aeromicrobium sp.]
MSATLRPVAGEVSELLELLRPWVSKGGEPIVIRTSGSSGQPKDVVLSHRAVLASATATHNRLGGPGQWLLALPPTGVAGLQVLVRSILAEETPVLASEHETLADAIGAMTGPRQYASLVPTQLHRLDASGDLSVLACLDTLLIGGAAVSPILLSRARDAGVNVVRTYGMSETCGGCVYDGRPLDGVRIRIGDDRQIHLAGPILFDGYGLDSYGLDGYGVAGETDKVLKDGWFATADLGELNPDGSLRVLGRADDVVISGGVNVSLPAVTVVLRDIEGVADAYAVAVEDPEWGQRVVGCLVGDIALHIVRDAVEAAGLPRTWGPRQLLILDAMPLLPGGKVDRLQLQERARGPR